MPNHHREPRHWTDEPDEGWRPTERLGSESERSHYGTGGRVHEDGSLATRDLGYPGSFEESRHGHGSVEPTGYRRTGFRGKGPRTYQRSDERIREVVCEALTDDDAVDATDITVTVEQGDVVLAGTVGDRAQKRAAEDCVERVGGVRDIQNLLRISR